MNKSIKKYILASALFFLASFAGLSIAEAVFSGSTPVGVTLPTSAQTGLSDRGIKDVLVGALEWLLGVVGIIALIGFAVSGIMYLLAAGNEKMADNGKRGMTYSIIGIVIVLGSFVIIQAIDYALRGSGSLFFN